MPRIPAVWLAFGLVGMALPAQAEPLDTLLHDLVKSHPQIAAAKQTLSAAGASKEEAFSGYLPTVDVNASGGFENIDRTDLVPAGSKTNEDVRAYSAAISQNLFK